MGESRTVQTEYALIHCWCGLPVLVGKAHARMYREQGESIHCSVGHGCIRKKTDNAKLQEKLNESNRLLIESRLATADAEEQAMNEAKKRKRFEKRIGGGVCPHCKRTFQNLARHMKCKHTEKV